jgi:hypothetical protein
MKIAYSKKETKNLGNYENVVTEVTIEDEVDFNIETADGCYERLKNFVNSKLAEHIFVNKNDNNEYHLALANVKKKISTLLSLDSDNRDRLKIVLKTYGGAEKLSDLTEEQLLKFEKQLGDI